MHASRKIKLTYPSVGSFCKEYKNNIQFGGVYVPTKKPAQFNDIVQLTITIPEIDDPLVINARVVQVNDESSAQETGQKPGMALHTIESDLPLLDVLRNKLQKLEIYRTMLELPAPTREKKPHPEPEAAPAKEPPGEPAESITPSAPKEEKAEEPAPEEPPFKEARDEETAVSEHPDSEPAIRITTAHPGKADERVEKPAARHAEAEEAEKAKPAPDKKPSAAPRVKIEWEAPEQPEEKVAPPDEKPSKPSAEAAHPSPAKAPISDKPVHTAVEKPGAAKPGRITDTAIEDLRKIVGETDEMARPVRKDIEVATPSPEPPRRLLNEKDRQRLAPVAKLAMSLVKAMLRSGYYSPDHPGSQDAKKGLYVEFSQAIQEEPELSFISRISREATDILVGGILDEPVSLRTVIPGSQAEMFFPKYKDYFERKRLVNFTIKRDINEKGFYNFINIMSDPTVDKGEGKEAGQVLTRALAEQGITSISAVFEDDLIRLELRLPWRVEMAINRLAKDLKMLPMYQDVTREEVQRLKKQIIQDIVRPLRQPHMLKDILVNAHLIAKKVEEVDPEDLEKTIISCFPMDLLLPTSEFIFVEMKDLKDEMEAHPDAEVLRNRLEGVKRILKWISLRVIEENLEEGLDFLEQLYFHEVLSFEELPEPVKERINTLRLAEAFQKNSSYYLSKFKEARVQDDYHMFLRFFRRILPELLDDNDYQNIYLLTLALFESADREPETLKAIRGDMESDGYVADEVYYVWSQSLPLLKAKFLGEKKETRTGLDEILVLVGDHGIELLIEVLEESQDRWVRKSAIDLLIKHGDRAKDYVRDILDDPARDWALHRNALFIIGNIGDETDIDRASRFMRHSDARLREESLNTISRLEGPGAEPRILRALKDGDARVRRRAVACLGLFHSVSENSLTMLAEIAHGPEKFPEDEKERAAEENVRVQTIHTLGLLGNQRLDQERNVEDLLIELVSAGKGWAKKILRRVAKVGEEDEKVQTAVVDTLAKIGTEKSLKALDELLEKKSGPMASKIKDAMRQIEARGVEEKPEKDEAGPSKALEQESEEAPEHETQPSEKPPEEEVKPFTGEGREDAEESLRKDEVVELTEEADDVIEELTEEVPEE